MMKRNTKRNYKPKGIRKKITEYGQRREAKERVMIMKGI